MNGYTAKMKNTKDGGIEKAYFQANSAKDAKHQAEKWIEEVNPLLDWNLELVNIRRVN